MYEQYTPPMSGTLRITNPKTLEKWIQNGNFDKELDNGYKFYVGCGRFRLDTCTCSKCRKSKGEELQQVLNKYKK
jgi:hypothetical protein